MDSAYDAPEIAAKSRALGHVPIIDPNPRRGGKADAEAEARAKRHAGHVLAEDVRFNERSAAERVNGWGDWGLGPETTKAAAPVRM